MKPECYVYTNDRDSFGPVCRTCQRHAKPLEEVWRWEPVFGDDMNHDSCERCSTPIHCPTFLTDRRFEDVLELSYGAYHEEYNEGRHPVYRWLLDYCASSQDHEWDPGTRMECFRSLAQSMWESPRKFHDPIPQDPLHRR